MKSFIKLIMIVCLVIVGIIYAIGANDQAAEYLHGFSIISVDEKVEELPNNKLISQDNENIFFRIKNESDTNLKLSYSSSKRYEFILTKNGEEVYRTSQLVLCEFKEKILSQNEREIYNVKLSNINIDPGKYEYETYSVARELKEILHLKGFITID